MRYRLFFENGISSFLKKDSVLLDRSSYFDQITVQIIKTDYLLSPACLLYTSDAADDL